VVAPSLHSVVEPTTILCGSWTRDAYSTRTEWCLFCRSAEQLLDLLAHFQPALPEIVADFIAEGIEL
jgi:hypothetical protein